MLHLAENIATMPMPVAFASTPWLTTGHKPLAVLIFFYAFVLKSLGTIPLPRIPILDHLI